MMDPPAMPVLPSPALSAKTGPMLSEKAANQLTHSVGLVLGVVGTVILLQSVETEGDSWQVIGCQIYAAALIATYAASTLSHSFRRGRLRHFFRTLDQVCILLLITGTFTPFAMTYLRNGWSSYLLPAMWGLALGGALFKIFVRRLENLPTGFYVLLGWLPALVIPQMFETVHLSGFAWVLAGGVFYTIGTLFLVRDEQYRYFHATWHLFVIAGSVCHYIFVLFFVAS